MRLLIIASLGLRRVLRDRSSLFFTLMFPVIITALIGLTIFKNQGQGITTGIVDLSHGPLAMELVQKLDSTTALATSIYSSVEDLRVAVRRDAVQAGAVIPQNYDTQLRDGGEVEIQFLASPRSGSPAAARSTISQVVTDQGTLIRAASFAAQQGFGSFDENLTVSRSLRSDSKVLVSVDKQTVGSQDNDQEFQGFNYPVASNLVLFMFITSMTAAAQIIEARQQGISNRQLAAPLSPTQVLLGQMLSRFVIAMFQGLFIFAIGWIAFGVEWGNPLGAGLLIVAFALVSTGVAMLFGSVLRTPQQASIGVPVGIGLGMLGGCMWPLEIVSPTMKTVGHLTPHAWAMDGFIKLLGSGGGVSDIAPQLGVLAGIALVLIAISSRQFRKSLIG